MSKRSAPRRRRQSRPLWSYLASARLRAFLSLGILVGFGSAGTMAYWTDEGTITGTTFNSGTLDLTAGPTTGSEFLGTTGPNNWAFSGWSISNLIPNESLSRTIMVRNSGTTPFTYNGNIVSSNNDLVSGVNGLLVKVFDNSVAATQTGSEASGNRAGECTGGTEIYSQNVSVTTGGTNLHTTAPQLNSGVTRSYCVKVFLPSTAPNTLQTKTTTLTISLNAKQLGAP